MLESAFAEGQRVHDEEFATIYAEGTTKATWCQLYELPFIEHVARLVVVLGAAEDLKSLTEVPDPLAAIPSVIEKTSAEIEAMELSKEELEEYRKHLQVYWAIANSMLLTLRSVMTYGLYLNELIELSRGEGEEADAALLKAIKIDPTVLACPSVSIRMSRAVMSSDKAFLGRIKRAINASLTKREQKNYQNMRLVLQALHEADALRLNEHDLYELFVKELKLVSRDREGDKGNVANNLRQFAYQFVKAKPVSQNA